MKRPFADISVLVILAITISCGGTRMEPRQMLTLNLQPASATPASGVDVTGPLQSNRQNLDYHDCLHRYLESIS